MEIGLKWKILWYLKSIVMYFMSIKRVEFDTSSLECDADPSSHFKNSLNWKCISLEIFCSRFLLILLLISLSRALDPPNQKKTSQTVQLPPCQACKNLVNSFVNGMERTARGKFEGGDADWEESRLGNYATSEVRLVEIQEKLCTDIAKGEDQVCLTNKTNDCLNHVVFLHVISSLS